MLLGNMIANIAYASVSAVLILDLKRSGADGWLVAGATIAPLLALIFLELPPVVHDQMTSPSVIAPLQRRNGERIHGSCKGRIEFRH